LWIAICLAVQSGCHTTSLSGPIKLRGLEFVGPPAVEAQRSELKESLQGRLADGRIRAVWWDDGHTRRDAFVYDDSSGQSPPPEVLQLAEAVAPYPLSEVEGVVLIEGERHAASARHGADGTIEVLIGDPPIRWDDQPRVEPEELSARFGIGPVIGIDGRNWSQAELRAIVAALSLLSADELRLLQGLPFVRRDKKSEKFGLFRHFASISYAEGALYPSGSLQFFDLGSSLDEHYIAGPPNRAVPYSCHVLVHEFGHAVARMPHMALIERHNENLKMYRILIAAETAPVLRRKLSMTRAERMKLRKQIEAEVKASQKIVEDIPPMERAYGELPGALPGPTPYARRKLSESFAESFALYHIDPDALQRIAPEIFEWFDSGQHIESIDYPDWTQVRDELRRLELESSQLDEAAAGGEVNP